MYFLLCSSLSSSFQYAHVIVALFPQIYLQSRCEFNEEFGTAKNEALLWNVVNEDSSATASNITTYIRSIEFTPPCVVRSFLFEIIQITSTILSCCVLPITIP